MGKLINRVESRALGIVAPDDFAAPQVVMDVEKDAFPGEPCGLETVNGHMVQLRVSTVFYCNSADYDAAREVAVQNLNRFVYDDLEADVRRAMQYIYSGNKPLALQALGDLLDEIRGR